MPEKKKILFAITKGNFGGAQRYVYDLATNLPKDKFEAVVACGEGGLLKEKLAAADIRVIEIEGLGREIDASKDLQVFKSLIKIVKQERPAILHLNSSKIGLLGVLATLYIKLFASSISPVPKTIFTAHGWAFNEDRNVWFKVSILFLHWLTVILSWATIAVSEKARKDISYLPFADKKTMTIYNGIDKFKTLPKEEARRILASKDSEKTIIFSISELHKNKGIDVALKAISSLPKEARENIIYTVAGDGEEKERLEKLAIDVGIGDAVRFLGFVPNARELLSGCDIFILPSRTEALPYALLEAGATGLPIIATSVGGIPEVIRDMQNGILIHPRNPKETAEAILYLLDHPNKKKEFGSEIKKTVTNFFSLDKMLGETINLYNKVP